MWDKRYAREQFQYGLKPNQFLEEQSHFLSPKRQILAVADGEGRNGVWLAEQGHRVLSVDGSKVATEKAQKLAVEREVIMATQCTDLYHWGWPENQYDCVVSIYFHMQSSQRQRLHRNMVRALRPNGLIILEAFSKDQYGRDSGGPPDQDWLYSVDELREDFKDLQLECLEEVETTLDEGPLHCGKASVVRLIGMKCSSRDVF
ncbi:putative Tellurite resistance protein TehB [Candidatus Terasakiella magnetica]|uniref:Putative Tellurite resistance protein TehB n=1 Tax=Candidatus Terasakiella magnetica TaxID=1867952 RepID=A0A1C3RFI5_9PROT|nr:class I SAM-dependent methyltransferase [Candidatus Terasakiella magnetica]SCA56015.1 putative Tellurite resistance protein TehB [Candidatus Terasakiella magnetica]